MSDIGQDATPQVVDRKEMLLEQFDAVEAAQNTQQPDKPAAQAAPATTAAAVERARDEAGKFLAKDKAAPVVAQASAGPAVQAQPVTEPQPWEKAPKSWQKDKRALWDAMTPEQRQYAFQREEQMRAGVEAAIPKAEFADKINKVAEPYMNTIRGLGMDLPTAVEGLMRVDHQLRTLPYEQKLAMLNNVARGYGIDLSGQMQTAQPGYDPNMQALQNELLNIKGQFSSFTAQQEAAQQAAAQAEIQNFARTAEHFDEVRPAMAKLLESGMADNIQDAYEKAVRLTPDIFDSIQSARQAAADAEKRATADAAAKRARTAAVSVKSATPGAAKPTNAQDRRSMLREQLDSLSERF